MGSAHLLIITRMRAGHLNRSRDRWAAFLPVHVPCAAQIARSHMVRSEKMCVQRRKRPVAHTPDNDGLAGGWSP